MLPPYPYPGLRPYEEEDSEIFFGRKELTDKLYKKLLASRFVSVVGESGCGKSSLVKAGLFPMAAEQHWGTIKTKPGRSPMDNLASALEKFFKSKNPSDFAGSLKSTLNLNSNGLNEIYFQSNYEKPLLICIDQFEEIFDFAFEKDDVGKKRLQEAMRFINLLISTSKQDEFPIYILITMRSDFVGACSRFKGLPELVSEGQFLTPRLTRYQYQEAIVRPLELFGYRISPNVVSQMLNDVEDDPDQLPVLQHALRRMWEKKKVEGNKSDSEVTLEDYKEIGGVMAIEHHAKELIKGFSKEQMDHTKAVFKALTELVISQNMESGIRKRRKVAELLELTNLSTKEIFSVVSIFCQEGVNFLQSSEVREGDELNAVVDLSHESLMRKWPELFDWMREEYSDKLYLKRLIDEANQYDESKTSLLSRRAVEAFMDWKRMQIAGFKGWAKRYASTPEIDRGLFYLNLSRKSVNQTKLIIGTVVALVVLVSLPSIIFINNNLRSFETISRFSKHEFRAFHNYLGRDYGTYPAYLAMSSWTETARQTLNLPFPLYYFALESKQLVDSLSRATDSLRNVHSFWGNYPPDTTRSQQPAQIFSRNRSHSYRVAGESDYNTVIITSYRDPQVVDTLQFSTEGYGLEDLFSMDENVFYRSTFRPPFMNQSDRSSYAVEAVNLDTKARVTFHLPTDFAFQEKVNDLVWKENNTLDIYVTTETPRQTIYKLYRYAGGRLSRGPLSTFQIPRNDTTAGYEVSQQRMSYLIPIRKAKGAWSYYDKSINKEVPLPDSLQLSGIKYLDRMASGNLVLIDQENRIYLEGKVLKALSNDFDAATNLQEVYFVNEKVLSLIMRSGGFLYLCIVELERDRLHVARKSVSPGDYSIINVVKDVIVIQQPGNRNSDMVFFLDSARRTTSWNVDFELPAKFRPDYTLIGLQTRKK